MTYENPAATVTIDGVGRSFTAVVGPDGVQLNREGALFDIRRERTEPGVDADTSSDPTLVSPMPGTVMLTPAADGDVVGATHVFLAGDGGYVARIAVLTILRRPWP